MPTNPMAIKVLVDKMKPTGSDPLSRRTPPFEPESPYMRIHEGAKYLKMSYSTLLRLIHDGEIPAFQAGKGMTAPWVVKKADLDAWAEKNKFRSL